MPTTVNITGTSTSTPTTVANAAPDSNPNRAIAAATASSKKFEVPIIAAGAAVWFGINFGLRPLLDLREAVMELVIKHVLPREWLTADTKFHINPTGRFEIGGPMGDAGLTGRKIIVDTYGGTARHGGGAFSGKDPSKVDRSAAYAARYVAKNIVAAGLADRCEVQVSYAIGVAEPTSISVFTFGTGKITDARLTELIREHFDLRPYGILKMLDLVRPIYKPTAAYGHFGREDIDAPWEKTDKAEALKGAAAA